MRASKRYSVTALYLSMNANQKDLEIEDDLARGMGIYAAIGGLITNRLQRKKHCEISRRGYRLSPRRTSFSRRMCGTSILG